TLQATVASLAQMFRTSVWGPLIRPRASEAALRRDHEPARIRMKCLADEPFRDLRSIRVRRVDECNAQLDQPLEHSFRLGDIPGLAPDPFACDPHRTETESIDREIAERHGAGYGCAGNFWGHAHESLRC